MKRTRKSKPGAKVWLAAIAMVLGLFALTEDEASAEQILSRLVEALQPASHSSTAITGTASVIDGDTLDIHGARIRLHGIDAPESGQTCKRGGRIWRCGQQAALALSDRIGRRTVTCEEKDVDRYGRVVAECSADGQNLNAWMVREGWAVAYRRYGRDYVRDEDAARPAERGVWAGPFVMPWDWRKGARS